MADSGQQDSRIEQQAPAGSHTYSRSTTGKVWRVGLVLLAVVVCALIVFVLASSYDDPEISGQVMFLLLLSPAVLIWVPWGVRGTIRYVSATLTRYELSPDGLSVIGPFSRRHVRWDEIDDCELPSRVNRPPGQIVLRPGSGPAITIILDLGPPDGLRADLERYLPMLGPGDTQRVRLARHAETSVIRRTRRERVAGIATTICFRLLLGAAFLLAGFVFGRDYYNYRRIVADPVEVPGTVLAIDKGEKSSHARVQYEVGDRTFRTRRNVPNSFAEKVKEGDTVTVQYLRGDPDVARIKDWDLDCRRWILLLGFVPAGLLVPLLAFDKVRRQLASRSQEQQFGWAPEPVGDKRLVAMSPASLNTNHSAWPQRHEGWLVIRKLRTGGQGRTTDLSLAWLLKCLSRYDMAPRALGDTFVLLSPPQAARYYGWLGRNPSIRATYYVLDDLDPEDAEAFVLEHFAADLPPDERTAMQEDGFPQGLRFMCLDGAIGPFDRQEVRRALAEVLRAEMERFAYLEPEPGLLEADLSPVVNLAQPDDRLQVQIRRKRGYEILVVRNDESWAERFCLERDQWQYAGPANVPVGMKKWGCSRALAYLLLGPVLILTWLILRGVPLLLAPVTGAEERSRKRKLAEERAKRLK